MTRSIRSALMAILSVILAACGGGSDSALKLPGASLYTLTLSASPSSQTSNASPVTLTAHLTAPDGTTSVTGATIEFSSTVGRMPTGSAQTNGAGLASAVLFAGSSGSASGTATVRFMDPDGNVAVQTIAVSTLGDEPTTPGGGGGSTGTPTLSLAVLNNAGTAADATSPITDTSPGTARVTVIKADGSPASGIIVNFTAASIAELSQSTALTDASGMAQVTITAVAAGAGLISASAVVGTDPVSASVPFATGLHTASPLVLDLGTLNAGSFTADVLATNVTGSVAPNSSVTVTADVVDTANPTIAYASPVTVTFTSTCVGLGKATIDSSVTTIGGRATAIYRPNGCVGDDAITATVSTSTQVLTASATVNVVQADVGQIAFISATPQTIALAGTGGLGRLERSEVVFQVLGSDGTALSGKRVCFQLSTTAGGISLASAYDDSDNSGDVVAVVQAGTVPTPVRVNATLDTDGSCATEPAPLIQTVSDSLTISTGLPDQNSFSLAVSNHGPIAYNHDGVNVTVTAHAADHFNNPVPNGTAINFWTELGAIQPSCTTVSGACSVTWTSQNPRDDRDPTTVVNGYHDRKGRSTIVAYAVGEESFTDINGNGRFDTGEPFTDLEEVVKDNNEDGSRTILNLDPLVFQDEEFVDFDGNFSFDSANGVYDGVLCTTATLGTTCSGDATVHVRESQVIKLSTDANRIYPLIPYYDLSGVDYATDGSLTGIAYSAPSPGSATYTLGSYNQIVSIDVPAATDTAILIPVIVTDQNGNAPGVGTTVKAATTGQGGTVDGTSSYTVPEIFGTFDPFYAAFTIKKPTDPGSGYITITTTTGGFDTSYVISIYWH